MASVTFEELTRRPRWVADTACRDFPEWSWFPISGSPAAKIVAACDACPVRAECLTDALEHDEQYGIRGGMTRDARLRLAETAA